MYKGTSIRLSTDFSAETASQKKMAWYIDRDQWAKPTIKNILPGNLSDLTERSNTLQTSKN